MATRPGLLTDWPWKCLGSFKYMILAPTAIRNIYSLATGGMDERNYADLLIIPFLLSRALHNQIWISISRHRTAKGNNRIVDRTIEFDQVDRESNWDDQILFNGLLLYILNAIGPKAYLQPIWRTDGVIITILLHIGPVEYIYYWLHRALHHHYLYSRYHSHHHSSIVTEPITSVVHPFAEHIAYYAIFFIPILVTIFTGTSSMASLFGYATFIDLMNNMGHCNFELIPKWAYTIFPPLKYLMYTRTFHSLHHTQFRTNYSVFMPFYDYIHGTMDKSTDSLYEKSLKRREDLPDVVHLTHLTTPESLFHLQVGFASFASRPQNYSKWLLWLMWPLSWLSVIINFIHGREFVVERNLYGKLKLQSWAIPRYSKQGEELNRNGAVFVERHPKLKTKLVDGSSLAVAVVQNSIPKGTTQVLFRGSLSKLAFAIVSGLCQQGIQVATFYENEKLKLCERIKGDIVHSKSYTQMIWIVGDGVSEEEQLKAPKGTLFIPYSHFPPKKARNDALYCHTPSMAAPPSLRNLNFL